MRYDLDVVEDLCREIGLAVHPASDQRVEIDLGEGAVLCFQNSDNERDCLIGFLGMPWHVHDNLGFYGAHGHYIEIDYLDLLVGLKEGKILISLSG